MQIKKLVDKNAIKPKIRNHFLHWPTRHFGTNLSYPLLWIFNNVYLRTYVPEPLAKLILTFCKARICKVLNILSLIKGWAPHPPPLCLLFLASTSHLLLIFSTHALQCQIIYQPASSKIDNQKYIIDTLVGTSTSMFGTIQSVIKLTKADYAT